MDTDSKIVVVSHFFNPILWIILHLNVTFPDPLLNPWLLYVLFFAASYCTYSSIYATRRTIRFKREHNLTFNEFYSALILYLSLVMLVIPFGIAVIIMIIPWYTPPLLLLGGIVVILLLWGCCFGSTKIAIEACIAVHRIAYFGIILSYIVNLFAISLYGLAIGPWAYWLFEFACAFIFGFTLTIVKEKI